MDARRQLMINRMTDVVVNGVKAGLVKPKQVAPLLDKIERAYGTELPTKRLSVSVHVAVGDALVALPVPVPTEAIGAYSLAFGSMVMHKLGNPQQILDAIEKLARALVSVREPLQLNIESFRFATTEAGISVAENLLGDGSTDHKRFCAALAVVLELQNIVGKTTVELYLKARTLKAGAVSDVSMYFDEVVRDKGLAAELDVGTYEHLIRCALKLDQMPYAESMSYHLVTVEIRK